MASEFRLRAEAEASQDLSAWRSVRAAAERSERGSHSVVRRPAEWIRSHGVVCHARNGASCRVCSADSAASNADAWGAATRSVRDLRGQPSALELTELEESHRRDLMLAGFRTHHPQRKRAAPRRLLGQRLRGRPLDGGGGPAHNGPIDSRRGGRRKARGAGRLRVTRGSARGLAAIRRLERLPERPRSGRAYDRPAKRACLPKVRRVLVRALAGLCSESVSQALSDIRR